eukprot:8313453-Ditylum_brightwellii.AAC.1
MGYSGGLYNLLAACLNLPTDRTIREYKVPTSNEPDGLMIQNIIREIKIFDSKHPDAGRLSWKRHCSLVFDAMICKGSFVVNFHTNEVVGIAHDCLKTDAIRKELEKVQKYDSNDDGSTEKEPIPELAKHFIVFICTLWLPDCRQQFLCAWFGMKSINSAFLIPMLRKIILILSFYGFIVDTVVGDGAAEN